MLLRLGERGSNGRNQFCCGGESNSSSNRSSTSGNKGLALTTLRMNISIPARSLQHKASCKNVLSSPEPNPKQHPQQQRSFACGVNQTGEREWLHSSARGVYHTFQRIIPSVHVPVGLVALLGESPRDEQVFSLRHVKLHRHGRLLHFFFVQDERAQVVRAPQHLYVS